TKSCWCPLQNAEYWKHMDSTLRRAEDDWNRCAMPKALRRFEVGEFTLNEMQVLFYLIRNGCRPWLSVRVSATRIGTAINVQKGRVGRALSVLAQGGVVIEVVESQRQTGGGPRYWGVSDPDTWISRAAAVSEKDTSLEGVDEGVKAALRVELWGFEVARH